MKSRLFLIIYSFLTIVCVNKTYGQIILREGQGINTIELGKSTLFDAINEFGSNYELSNQNISEKWSPNFDNGSKKSITYPELGITFQCYDTTDLVIGISLKKPFTGITPTGFRIKLDSTTNGSVLRNFENLVWRTSAKSEYWVLLNDSIKFHTVKDTSLKPYPLDTALYKAKEIAFISFGLDFFSLEEKTDNDFSYYKPLYAPDSVTHLNAAIRINYTGEIKKNGIWQEYYSNHKLKSVGNFERDYPTGKHLDFDEDGKLINSVIYPERSEYLFFTLLSSIILLLSLLIWKYARQSYRKPRYYLYPIIGLGLHFLLYGIFPVGCGGSGLLIVLSIPFIIVLSILLSLIGYYLRRKGFESKLYHLVCLILIVFVAYYSTPFCHQRDPVTLLRDYLPL